MAVLRGRYPLHLTRPLVPATMHLHRQGATVMSKKKSVKLAPRPRNEPRMQRQNQRAVKHALRPKVANKRACRGRVTDW